jgi:hypothetical protein
VSATLLAASQQHQRAAHASGVHMNGHAPRTGEGQPPALLRVLKANINPDSTREVSLDVTEASLDAVGRLGGSAAGAKLLFVEPPGIAHDVAALALGRTGTPRVPSLSLHCPASTLEPLWRSWQW